MSKNYEGILKIKRGGFGEICDTVFNKKVKVDKCNINFNFDGDKVKFEILKEGDNSIYAKIISKTEYKDNITVGMVHHFYKTNVFIYNDKFGKSNLIYCENNFPNLEDGSFVKVKIDSTNDDKFYGTIIEVFGNFDDNIGLTNYFINYFNLSTEFSEKVLKKSEKTLIRYYSEKDDEHKKRKDLRHLRTVTIDPAGARDLDDAISIIKHEVGYKLYVHIADVSYFVLKDNSIDRETIKRSFSVYLPNQVIRMLPPILSENLCSLLPYTDKYAVTTEINLNKYGNLVSYEIYKSVIKSDYKFSYEEVYDILEGKKEFHDGGIVDDLFCLKELSEKLERERLKMPEVRFNKGVELYNSDYSHRMIEEAMILNNIISATELNKRGLKYPSRYHPKPLEEYSKGILDNLSLINERNINININSIQSLFDNDNFNLKAYNFHMTQRLLTKAKYCNTNEGHWALNLNLYSHFTSPIRRVPDIISHRLIFDQNYEDSEMDKILKICNENEFKYQKIDFLTEKFKRIRYIKNSNMLGSLFNAIVTDVRNPTITLFIPDLFLTHDMHVSDFSSDKLNYDKENNEFTGSINLKVNQWYKLKLNKIILSMLELRFTIAE